MCAGIRNQVPLGISNFRPGHFRTAIPEGRVSCRKRCAQTFIGNLFEDVLCSPSCVRPSIIFGRQPLQNLSAHEFHANVNDAFVGREHFGIDPRQTVGEAFDLLL